MGLDELLRQQPTEADEKEESKRKEIIERFKCLVNDLYRTITEDWLSQFIQSAQIQIEYGSINIKEEKLGEYTIPTLQIKLMQKTIELQPKGTIMLGTNARIDVVFMGIGRMMIVRAREKIMSSMQMVDIHIAGEKPKKKKDLGQMEWKLVDPNNRLSLTTLDKQAFEQMIVNIVTHG